MQSLWLAFGGKGVDVNGYAFDVSIVGFIGGYGGFIVSFKTFIFSTNASTSCSFYCCCFKATRTGGRQRWWWLCWRGGMLAAVACQAGVGGVGGGFQ